MKTELHIRLINKPHPYPEQNDAHLEAWGLIVVEIIEDLVTILAQTQYNLEGLAEWFIENREAICHEELVIGGETALPAENLYQAQYRLHQRDFEDPDEEATWFDALYAYYTRHNIWFGLDGSKIPSIVIGCNHGMGEISRLDEEEKWSYQFDMAQFVEDFQKEISQFIQTWRNSTDNPAAHTRADRILSAINQPVGDCCEKNKAVFNKN